MSLARSLCAVLVLLAATCGMAQADVVLDARARDNLGIQTEKVTVTAIARTWPAAAQVLDVSPLASLLSDLRSAESAAAASASELARAEQLHRAEQNVALKAVEAARSQAMLDAGHVTSARSQLMATWGTSIASLAPPARDQLLQSLLDGRASLVRAEPTSPLPVSIRIAPVAQLRSIDGSRTWAAEVLGPLPQTTAPSIGGAILLRVASAMPAGQLLVATIQESGTGVRGISVPAVSIVRWHGAEWIYEETQPNHFARHPVESSASIAGRVVIPSEHNSSITVVTVGSRALLGAEQGAPEED